MTWAKFHADLHDCPNVEKLVSDRLANTDNPTGDEEDIDIYKVHQEEVPTEDANDTDNDTDNDHDSSSATATSDESSSEDEADSAAAAEVSSSPEEKRTRSEKASVDTVEEHIQKIIGDKKCVMHGTRGTVHIVGEDGKTACGDSTKRWPAVVDMSTKEVASTITSLCNKAKCFKAMAHMTERVAMVKPRRILSADR